MASCQTSKWTSTAPYVKLTVTGDTSYASNDTVCKLDWELLYFASSAADTSSARDWTVKIGGETKTGTFSIDGKTSSTGIKIASGSVYVNRTTEAKKVDFSVSFEFDLTWSGSYAGTKTASSSVSIAKKTSYTVKYNANGGTGAPSAQTKWHGTSLTLRTGKPTRTGYTFKCWNAKADGSGSTNFDPGGTYIGNADVTLYAQWTPNTYKVTFDTNGGTGGPGSQNKNHGVNLTLSSTKPTRPGYIFKGWGLSKTTTTVSYNPGGSYTNNAAITLYAIWEVGYANPRISSFSVSRDATNATTGKYNLDYACDETLLSIVIKWKPSSSSSYSNSKTVTGTSGTFGDNALDPEVTYDVQVIVTDTGGSSQSNVVLPTDNKYYIDFLAGNYGVGIGKAATKKDMLEIGFDIEDKFGTKMGNGLTHYGGSSNLEDPDTTIEHLTLTNVNCPIGNYFMYIHTVFYNEKSTTANRAQIAIPYGITGSIYHRFYYNGSWSEWRRLVNYDEFPMRQAVGVTFANGGSGHCYYYPALGMCFLRLYVTGTAIAANTEVTVCTIPEAYRPTSLAALAVAHLQDYTAQHQAYLLSSSNANHPGAVRFISSVAKEAADDIYITGWWYI